VFFALRGTKTPAKDRESSASKSPRRYAIMSA
jgi:hypothetical protein